MALADKDEPLEVASGWLCKTSFFLDQKIFPLSVFLLLTGMLWLGKPGLYSKMFYWAVMLPALLSVTLSPKKALHLWKSQIFLAYLPFACYVALSSLWSVSEDSSLDLMKRPVFVLLLFYSFSELGRQRFDLLNAAVKWAAVFSIVIAVYSLGLFVSAGGEGRFTGYGALFNPLLASHVFGFFLAWWLGVYFTEQRLFSPMTVLAVLILIVLILATGSRTPLVAMVVTIFWLSLVTRNSKGGMVIGALLLAGVLAWLLAPEIVMQRGLSYRTEIWANVLRQIGERPWFGHGLSTPIWVRLDTLPYPLQDPHNLTLSVLFAGGLVGGLLWLVLYLTALLESWRWRCNKWVQVYSATLVYGLMAGMTEGGAFLPRPKEHWFLVWIPLALMVSAVCQAKTRIFSEKS